jgi:hypothetical protein
MKTYFLPIHETTIKLLLQNMLFVVIQEVIINAMLHIFKESFHAPRAHAPDFHMYFFFLQESVFGGIIALLTITEQVIPVIKFIVFNLFIYYFCLISAL